MKRIGVQAFWSPSMASPWPSQGWPHAGLSWTRAWWGVAAFARATVSSATSTLLASQIAISLFQASNATTWWHWGCGFALGRVSTSSMAWVVRLMPSHCGWRCLPIAFTADWSRGLVGLLGAGGMVTQRGVTQTSLARSPLCGELMSHHGLGMISAQCSREGIYTGSWASNCTFSC